MKRFFNGFKLMLLFFFVIGFPNEGVSQEKSPETTVAKEVTSTGIGMDSKLWQFKSPSADHHNAVIKVHTLEKKEFPPVIDSPTVPHSNLEPPMNNLPSPPLGPGETLIRVNNSSNFQQPWVQGNTFPAPQLGPGEVLIGVPSSNFKPEVIISPPFNSVPSQPTFGVPMSQGSFQHHIGSAQYVGTSGEGSGKGV